MAEHLEEKPFLSRNIRGTLYIVGTVCAAVLVPTFVELGLNLPAEIAGVIAATALTVARFKLSDI